MIIISSTKLENIADDCSLIAFVSLTSDKVECYICQLFDPHFQEDGRIQIFLLSMRSISEI